MHWTELSIILWFYTDKGQPRDIVKSIKPVWNNFVFFEVNLVSFHQVIMKCGDSCVLLSCQQVSEILCTGKTRLSINGWFHGIPIARPAASHETPLQYWSPMPTEVIFCTCKSFGGKYAHLNNHFKYFNLVSAMCCVYTWLNGQLIDSMAVLLIL